MDKSDVVLSISVDVAPALKIAGQLSAIQGSVPPLQLMICCAGFV
jgi:hypothetical protein